MVKQSQLRIPEMQAVKCIDGKIYFIQDGTLMRYAGGETENLRIACSSSYDVYEDVVYWIGQDNFNSEIYKQKIGEESIAAALTRRWGLCQWLCAIRK